ncbi:MAG: FMN-binding protein [Bacteroidetes bacterium]|nr:FMN-binding protein [Bacteroidota bacterium]
MSSLRSLALAIALLLLWSTSSSAQNVGEKMMAALKRVFGESAQAVVQTATLSDQQLAAIRTTSGAGYTKNVSYYAVSVGGKRVGYGIVDDVKGKVKPITYAVIVDNNIAIKDLEVLVYRETYGGEVQYDAFRKQFRGKGTRDAYRIGTDIRNVSGATISSNAVAGGTRKLMAVFNALKSAGALR